MQHHNFSIGQELIFRSVNYSVVRVLDGRRIQLESLTGELSTHSEADLLRAFSKRDLFFLKKQGQHAITLQSDQPRSNLLAFPIRQQNEILHRAQYAMRIDHLQKTHGIVEAAKTAIKELEKPGKKPPGLKTVYAWHKKWRRSGRDVCSLANIKRGPRKFSTWFNEDIQSRIYRCIAEKYLNESRQTLTDVYEQFIAIMKMEAKELGKRLKLPSLATFYRHLGHFDKYEVECYRNGKLAADRKFRYIGAGVLSTRALERAEIDHTPLDVILVEREGKSLGRAWLTLILDHFTKAPLGFYVSRAVPAQVAVLEAMRHAILPKFGINEQYPDIVGQWLCYGIPSVLVFDNALEFHAHNIRRACAGLGITMMYCPPRHPHYKGSIERFLGTMNRSVSHNIPGTTKSNVKQRGDYDSEGKAILTLAELTELINMWIIDVYMNDQHRVLNDTPRNIWNNSVADFPPVLPSNCEEMELLLSHQGKKTLTGQGIVHHHVWYNSDELYALFRRNGGKTHVKYQYDVHDMGHVWVIDEIDNSYIKVPAVYFEYADGLTLEQHREIRRLQKDVGIKNGSYDAMLEGRLRLFERIAELVSSKKTRDRRKGENLRLKDQVTPDTTETIESAEASAMPQDAKEAWGSNAADLPTFI